jgi:O-antigen/teichoic acid export membrane protein
MPGFLGAPGPARRVRRNALWNLFGLGFPLLLAFLFMPRLVTGMGVERFGVLSLALTFLNYFAFFDLGIGRALTQALAERDPEDKRGQASLIWTVSIMLGVFGSVAALAFILVAPHLVYGFLRMKEPVAAETVTALRLLGLGLPFLIHSLALRGILESRSRFDLSNIVRVPAGIFTFGAPILVLPFSRHVAVVVGVVLLGRLIAWVLNLWMVLRLMPHLATPRAWDRREAARISRSGGWFTVSNLVGPVIDGMDRFMIGRMVSLSMVSYYALPYDMIIRLGILSGSVGGAIFPEFAARLRAGKAEAAMLYARGYKYLFTLLFPFVLAGTAYAGEGLAWWVNPEFAVHATAPLQWLSILVLLSGVNSVSVALLHGAGRPDLTARQHLIELPLLVGMLYVLIRLDGIRGAAIACMLRLLFEFVCQFFYSARILDLGARACFRLLAPLAAALGVLVAFQIPMAPGLKLLLFLLVLGLHAVAAWRFVLEPDDKAKVSGALGRLRRR